MVIHTKRNERVIIKPLSIGHSLYKEVEAARNTCSLDMFSEVTTIHLLKCSYSKCPT